MSYTRNYQLFQNINGKSQNNDFVQKGVHPNYIRLLIEVKLAFVLVAYL